MEFIQLDNLTKGYRERMRRLALMDPLNELAQKRKKDQNDKPIDMRGLGMLMLLFFYERRLSRAYKTSRKDVSQFLFMITADVYEISREQMTEITNELIEVFRPQDGRKRIYTFFNWETKKLDEIEYTILKAHDFDATTETQYYTLDEDGLELLFATKEFYSEFQISINQLLLKQQIDKGQFHDAARQVREMEISVTNLIEKFENMRTEIVRSIVSDHTFQKYKKLIEEAHERFEHEDEEFKTLKQFVQETRDTMYKEHLKEQESESYELIHQIANELDEVHYKHTKLIELIVKLRKTAIETAQESLYYTGVQSFNFEKDIVATIIGRPLSPDKTKVVIHPFLKIEQNPTWSLLSVLEDQNVMEEREEKEGYYFPEANEDFVQQEYREWLGEKYRKIIEIFLSDYETNNITTLKEWMEVLQETNPSLLEKRYFYSFWMLMHQVSPLQQETITNHDSENLLQIVHQALEGRQITVTELPDIVHYGELYSIQNMKIELE